MARSFFIKPIEPVIVKVYRDNPQGSAKEIYSDVKKALEEEAINHPELMTKLRRGWPKLNSIQVYLTKLRKDTKKGGAKYDRKDEPWSLSCLAEYDIPPEALPRVMFICEDYFRKFKQHLTIRQVLWMARLYKIIDDPLALRDFALMYELHEWFDWVSGNHSDNRSADLVVIQYMAGRTERADIKDELGEFYIYIATHPLLYRSLQAWAKEDAAEIEKKLERDKNERKHKAKRQK